MSGKVGEEGAGLDVPDFESAVGAPAADESTVSWPRDLIDCTHVASQTGHVSNSNTYTIRETWAELSW